MGSESIFRNRRRLNNLLLQKGKPSLQELKNAFHEAVEKECRSIPKAAVLFSGGLDSSLIAKGISRHASKTMLFTAGFPNSTALRESKKAARALQLPLHQARLSTEHLEEALPAVKKAIKSNAFLQLQIALPLFLAMHAAKQHGFPHVFTGQGADELFCGYNEFRSLLADHSYNALEEFRLQLLQGMWKNNLKRDTALAAHLSLSLHNPFLAPCFIKQALAFPAKENVHGSNDLLRKHALRRLAKEFALPKQIAERKKKAVQYDSGVSKRLKKILRP